MYRNLDMAAMRSFVTVAETGAVTRAANRLNLTQSAVSMQIKRLEAALGQSLMERVGRGVSLTREGEQLAGYGRRILALNDEAWHRMTHADVEGEVSFGVPKDIVHPYVPTILRGFNTAFPRANIRLITATTKTLKDGFEAGTIDLILTTEQAASPGTERLTERALLWFGATAGTAHRKRPLPLAYEPDCMFRPLAIDALERAEIAWTAPFGATDWRDYSAFVSADLAVVGILEGTQSRTWEPVGPESRLPPLPKIGIYMYLAESANRELTAQLAGFVRDAFNP